MMREFYSENKDHNGPNSQNLSRIAVHHHQVRIESTNLIFAIFSKFIFEGDEPKTNRRPWIISSSIELNTIASHELNILES